MSEHGDGVRTCDQCERVLEPQEQFVTFSASYGYTPMFCLLCWTRAEPTPEAARGAAG